MAIKEHSWLRVHRAIRALPDGEGPFRGLLVADGDATAVAVALTELEEWTGWPFAGALHVAGPSDIALLDSGFYALMPWCTMQVEVLLSRRKQAEDPLSSGEAATLATSVLRGIAELGESAGRVSGRWWLTYDSRPVFVVGEGSSVGLAAADVFTGIIAVSADRRLNGLLERLGDAASRPRTLARDLERWESELLECAAPKPIRTESIEPRNMRGLEEPACLLDNPHSAVAAVRALRAQPVQLPPRGDEPPTNARWRRLLETGLERLPERFKLWDRGTDEKLSPRRRLAVGAVAAGIVILIGTLWPSGDQGVRSSVDLSEQPSAASDPVAPTSEPPSDPPTVSQDPLSGFIQGIARARQCLVDGDELCATVLSSSADVTASTIVSLVDKHDQATLADDFGDIAVLRIASSESEFAIVLARTKQSWLVRDVYQLRGA